MYLCDIKIDHIKALGSIHWHITPERAPGWHVLIGDNGAGKTTFLRAVSMAILGLKELQALRIRYDSYVSPHAPTGTIQLLRSKPGDNTPYETSLTLNAHSNWASSGAHYTFLESFSAGFGAFRRFTGGDVRYDDFFAAHPRLAAHLSLFGEDVALTEALKWLQTLRFRDLERRDEGGEGVALLQDLIDFINQPELLPHQTRLVEISSKGVFFVDGRGARITLEQLSDGFRSILSLTLELLRQMAIFYREDGLLERGDDGKITAARAGVVLIDEVDAHLHPTWQRRVGLWFRRFFPKVQFIVATHSPFVCQAAEEGSVFWLPAPDSQEEARFLTGLTLDRVLYGNILEAYGTTAFGAVDRSPRAQEMLDTLARLNVKALHTPLTQAEADEQRHLTAIFSTQPAFPDDLQQRLALIRQRRAEGDG